MRRALLLAADYSLTVLGWLIAVACAALVVAVVALTFIVGGIALGCLATVLAAWLALLVWGIHQPEWSVY
jgi:hypothetical protein